MKLFRTKIALRLILFLLILLVAISFTGKTLLSLPFFYNQNPQQRALTFTILALSIGILVYFTSKIFILPSLPQLLKWKNRIFLAILVLALSIILGINSANYWSIPEIHTIEICFDAHEGAEGIKVQKLVESNTNHLFSPDSFSQKRYPVFVNSGECANGNLVYLTSLLTRALIIPRLTVFVEQNPPEGRFFISVNEAPSVVYFNQENDTQPTNEIIITDGLNQGSQMAGPWRQYWFIGLKAIGVFISAAFLSLFLFGLTEKIITASKTNYVRSNRN